MPVNLCERAKALHPSSFRGPVCCSILSLLGCGDRSSLILSGGRDLPLLFLQTLNLIEIRPAEDVVAGVVDGGRVVFDVSGSCGPNQALLGESKTAGALKLVDSFAATVIKVRAQLALHPA